MNVKIVSAVVVPTPETLVVSLTADEAEVLCRVAECSIAVAKAVQETQAVLGQEIDQQRFQKTLQRLFDKMISCYS